MSLDAILTSILAAGDERIGEIEEQGLAAPMELLEQSRLENERLRQMAREEVIRPAFREHARIVHRARLEAMQIVGDVCNNLVNTALEQIIDRLLEIRNDARYPQILCRLAEEALAELEDSSVEIGDTLLLAHPQDYELLHLILDDLGKDIPISCSLSCWGGVIATSRDEKITVINTIESRFERATPYLRQYLATLFERDQNQEIQDSVLTTEYI